MDAKPPRSLESQPGTPTPDHDRDVIVHVFAAVDALTGQTLGDRWSEERAPAAARDALTDAGDRPVWLVQSGRPPKLVASA
jgi:hypothetical protein